MVIVMPAFAKCQQRHPPIVSGGVFSVMRSVAKHMANAVNAEGTVEPNNQPHKNAPDHKRHSTPSVQNNAQRNLQQRMVFVAKLIKPIACHIFSQAQSLSLVGHIMHEPAQMTPPETTIRIMGIFGFIGVEMVHPVIPNPTQDGSLACQSAAHDQKIFNRLWYGETAMGRHPMESHGNPQANGDPIQKDRDGDRIPVKPSRI